MFSLTSPECGSFILEIEVSGADPKFVGSSVDVYLYLPDTPNTSRRVLRGVRAKMALIFSPNNQNITCKDVLIT